MPDIGVCTPLSSITTPKVGVRDLAELDPLDRRIFHVAIPVDADGPGRVVDGLRVGRVAEEFRLAGRASTTARAPNAWPRP